MIEKKMETACIRDPFSCTKLGMIFFPLLETEHGCDIYYVIKTSCFIFTLIQSLSDISKFSKHLPIHCNIFYDLAILFLMQVRFKLMTLVNNTCQLSLNFFYFYLLLFFLFFFFVRKFLTLVSIDTRVKNYVHGGITLIKQEKVHSQSLTFKYGFYFTLGINMLFFCSFILKVLCLFSFKVQNIDVNENIEVSILWKY